MDIHILRAVVKRLLAPRKGILAADESVGTADKRLAARNIPQTEEMRRQWRDLLLTAPEIETGLSGVILFDETLRQKNDEGDAFPNLLKSRGITVGVKVDRGLVNFPGFPEEKISQGLDDLNKRLAEYAALGAEFTKWRSVIRIEREIPTDECLEANAHILALYASLAQEANLLPVIEPEVLINGSHSIEKSEAVLIRTLAVVFAMLKKYRAELSGIVLKTSMALPGKEFGKKALPEEVATATLRALRASVPEEVPGVVFLSGGQSPKEATENLNAIAKMGPYPWQLTFSYARALQDPVMDAWAGKAENKAKAQEIFRVRVKETSLARQGEYRL